MSMADAVSVQVIDNVGVVELLGIEKRLNLQFLAKLNAAYDKVLSNDSVQVVVTIANGKFFSNGIDLEWFDKQDVSTQELFLKELNASLLRILTFPLPTVAAINGHSFAGGAMIALAHDYRIMRSKKGWICLNEIHIKRRFSEFLLEFVRVKIPMGLWNEMIALGVRLTGEEAKERGLVREVCELADLEDRAVTMAKSLVPSDGYDRDSLMQMKKDLYKSVMDLTHKYQPRKVDASAKL